MNKYSSMIKCFFEFSIIQDKYMMLLSQIKNITIYDMKAEIVKQFTDDEISIRRIYDSSNRTISNAYLLDREIIIFRSRVTPQKIEL